MSGPMKERCAQEPDQKRIRWSTIRDAKRKGKADDQCDRDGETQLARVYCGVAPGHVPSSGAERCASSSFPDRTAFASSAARSAFVRPNFAALASACRFFISRARVFRARDRLIGLPVTLARSWFQAEPRGQTCLHPQSRGQWPLPSASCRSCARSWPPWLRCHSRWSAPARSPASGFRA